MLKLGDLFITIPVWPSSNVHYFSIKSRLILHPPQTLYQHALDVFSGLVAKWSKESNNLFATNGCTVLATVLNLVTTVSIDSTVGHFPCWSYGSHCSMIYIMLLENCLTLSLFPTHSANWPLSLFTTDSAIWALSCLIAGIHCNNCFFLLCLTCTVLLFSFHVLSLTL